MPLPDQPIDVLQARIAHQEKAIADLSEARQDRIAEKHDAYVALNALP